MPKVEGQSFPEHVHHEYPKTLYRGGVSHDEAQRHVGEEDTRSVANGPEEAAAREEGFLPATEAGDEAPKPAEKAAASRSKK